jgi:hypothetical protein
VSGGWHEFWRNTQMSGHGGLLKVLLIDGDDWRNGSAMVFMMEL